MPNSVAVSIGLAGVALVLTLVAAGSVAVSVRSILRMRRHSRVLLAAERLEAVNLGRVVKRYLPPKLQSNRAAEEIALTRQVIETRLPQRKRVAVIAGVATVCFAVVTAVLVHRVPRNALLSAPGAIASQSAPRDVVAAIVGTWGWRADSQRSCSQSPRSFSVSSDRKTVSLRYAKAVDDESLPELDLEIVSVQADTVVLARADASKTNNRKPTLFYLKFTGPDTYIMSRSDRPLWSSGTIERCK